MIGNLENENSNYYQYTFQWLNVVLWEGSILRPSQMYWKSRMISLEPNQGSLYIKSMSLPTNEVRKSKGVWATLK